MEYVKLALMDAQNVTQLKELVIYAILLNIEIKFLNKMVLAHV
jgi:hypothetical protein